MTQPHHVRKTWLPGLAVAMLLATSPALAVNIWDGGGGDAMWTTAANWDNSDTLPVFDGSDDISIGTGFVSGTALDLAGNKNINSLTISTSTNVSIDNNQLTLQSGNITQSSSNTTTINSNILLGADADWGLQNGTAKIILNGVISDGGSGFGLTRTGSSTGGTLTINSNNSYSGVTTISRGTTFLNGAVAESVDGPLGNATSTVILGDGSTGTAGIQFYANGGTFGRKIHITNNGTGSVFLGGTGADNTFTNEIIFDRTSGARLYNNNMISTFEGVISGSGNVLLERGIRLKAANTYTGTTTVQTALGKGTRVATDAPSGAPGAFGNSTTAVTLQSTGSIFLDGAFMIGRDINIPAGQSVTIGSVNAATGTFAGGIAIGTGSTMTISQSGAVHYNGIISGDGSILRNGGSGNASHFNNTNTYTGTTELRIGEIFLGTDAPHGAPGALGNATSNVKLAPVNNAHITQVLTTGPYTVGRNFELAGTSTAPQTFLGGNTADASFFTGDISITTVANKAQLTAAAGGTATFSGNISGPGTVTTTGAGTVAISGTVASGLSIGSTSTLGGSGTIGGAISGSGMVDPGSSPGILTAAQIDPSGGMDFSFELTQFAPDYSNALSSANDVMRLTDATTPFASVLGGSNAINAYFNLPFFAGKDGNYTGGFYTDRSSDFLTDVSSASINYFARFAGGSVSYQGNDYEPFATAFPDATINLSTINPAGTQFGGEDGFVMQFSVSGLPSVPEPSSFLLLGFGALGLMRHARRRGRNAQSSRRKTQASA